MNYDKLLDEVKKMKIGETKEFEVDDELAKEGQNSIVIGLGMDTKFNISGRLEGTKLIVTRH